MADEKPIIIVKKKGGHGGHHGGAWKVAYADFVTAMMAFFLVMWLVNTADQSTKKAIAKRFKRTARGKIMHARGGKSHLLGQKSRKRKRHLRSAAIMSPADTKVFQRMLNL